MSMVTVGIGRLTADPELKEITSADGKTTCVARFTLASNEYRNSLGSKVQQTHFLDFEAWDSGARTLAEHAHKGDMLYVQATPRQNKWVTKEGENRQRIVFRAQNFHIIPKRGQTTEENELDEARAESV